jgi:hypothetical protein
MLIGRRWYLAQQFAAAVDRPSLDPHCRFQHLLVVGLPGGASSSTPPRHLVDKISNAGKMICQSRSECST